MINDIFGLDPIPSRPSKPREVGMNMVMDKGLGLKDVDSLLQMASDSIDLVKLGFGTAVVTPRLAEKIDLYRSENISVYFGGTLFEAYAHRGQLDRYRKVLDHYGLDHMEISDGSIEVEEDQKLEWIRSFAQDRIVLSEVGSKDAEKVIPPYKWIQKMRSELAAGSWKVIAEARESGTVGIYRQTGEVRSGLVEEILTQIPKDRIIWEAPMKAQQVWFLNTHGTDVNLGNIAPSEVLPLETLRLGLRGDTFNSFH